MTVPFEPDRLDAFTCATRSQCAGMYQDYNGDRYSITTDDGWRTWATHSLSRETGDISSIDCPTEAVCHAWSPDGTDGGQSLVSHDGGASWTVHQGPDTWRLSGARLSCPDANTCLAVGNLSGPVVLRTTDGGATWQRVASPDTNVTDVVCETVSVCVILTSTTAYVTTDLGDHLDPAPTPGRTELLQDRLHGPLLRGGRKQELVQPFGHLFQGRRADLAGRGLTGFPRGRRRRRLRTGWRLRRHRPTS